MTGLTDFVLARIADDEAVAGIAATGYGGRSSWFVSEGSVGDQTGGVVVYESAVSHLSVEHIARHDPARVLAECAAKRAIVNSRATFESVAAKTTDLGPKMTSAGAVAGLDVAIRYLASAYAEHPDYRSEWASV